MKSQKNRQMEYVRGGTIRSKYRRYRGCVVRSIYSQLCTYNCGVRTRGEQRLAHAISHPEGQAGLPCLRLREICPLTQLQKSIVFLNQHLASRLKLPFVLYGFHRGEFFDNLFLILWRIVMIYKLSISIQSFLLVVQLFRLSLQDMVFKHSNLLLLGIIGSWVLHTRYLLQVARSCRFYYCLLVLNLFFVITILFSF